MPHPAVVRHHPDLSGPTLLLPADVPVAAVPILAEIAGAVAALPADTHDFVTALDRLDDAIVAFDNIVGDGPNIDLVRARSALIAVGAIIVGAAASLDASAEIFAAARLLADAPGRPCDTEEG